ncbi:Hypothetical predicted protein [Mytilus galloprovincialis]|uniref:Uncharacterized protein n=1 Tax=Mytilus galloprovincialis TaxID=29158 RepID=A0A8B6FR46_MYTGA|nr:Hypothetical predicted protein [Mytilus galloprovincialis]
MAERRNHHISSNRSNQLVHRFAAKVSRESLARRLSLLKFTRMVNQRNMSKCTRYIMFKATDLSLTPNSLTPLISQIKKMEYILFACSESTVHSGRRASGYTIEAMDDRSVDDSNRMRSNSKHKRENRSINDDKVGSSIEDRTFLKIIDNELYKDTKGDCGAPLPFRNPREKIPNIRLQAVNRTKTLERSLQKHPTKKEHFFDFMLKVIENGHAELAPRTLPDEECWYLPIFGVCHAKKPGHIRVVFLRKVLKHTIKQCSHVRS